MYVCMYACMYVYMDVCMYVCMYVCMCFLRKKNKNLTDPSVTVFACIALTVTVPRRDAPRALADKKKEQKKKKKKKNHEPLGA